MLEASINCDILTYSYEVTDSFDHCRSLYPRLIFLIDVDKTLEKYRDLETSLNVNGYAIKKLLLKVRT